MWISKKKLSQLEEERDKLKQSIESIITSFNQSIELKQTNDRIQQENIRQLMETVTHHTQNIMQLATAIDNLTLAISKIHSTLNSLEKRIKTLEDFNHLNNKWVDLNKVPN